ncbi:MAG TPA: DUF393 domain-containing protein [Microbacteriaceae bacterium]|nr:DUF393 domain-containing protein [Microbacteriaceae bacterium]
MATLIYDGDCGVCTVAADWVRHRLRAATDVIASQRIDPGAFGLSVRDVAERVWLVTDSGRYGGHEAVAELLRLQPEPAWRVLGSVMRIPPISWLARLTYAVVARNRHRIRVGPVRCEVPEHRD